MACDITSGRLKACKNNIGGLATLYLFNYVEDAFTIVGGEATAVNPLVTAVYEYEIDGNTHNVVENFVGSVDAGTSVNTQTLTAMLKGMDAVTSAQLNTLVYGKVIAVVKDRNGNYNPLGIDDGMDFTVDAGTGSAKTDMNGYTLTGVATTGALSPILDSATVTAFLALVA